MNDLGLDKEFRACWCRAQISAIYYETNQLLYPNGYHVLYNIEIIHEVCKYVHSLPQKSAYNISMQCRKVLPTAGNMTNIPESIATTSRDRH